MLHKCLSVDPKIREEAATAIVLFESQHSGEMDREKPAYEFRFRGHTVWVLVGNPSVQGQWLHTDYCCLEDPKMALANLLPGAKQHSISMGHDSPPSTDQFVPPKLHRLIRLIGDLGLVENI